MHILPIIVSFQISSSYRSQESLVET